MRMYWQTNKLWHARFFNVFTSSRQFQHIAKFFHTYNNKAVPENNSDRLIKVRPVMEYLAEKFASVYVPKKELSLDEGTMAWRGRLSFKVYNPNKPDKYGVKFYMLAKGTSGYIYDFDVYCGIGKTTVETVMGLIAPLVKKGYHLYMDNYYNSVSLTDKLREVGVYTCGTLRLQRGAPKDLQQQAKEFHEIGIRSLLLWNSEERPATTTIIPHAQDIDANEGHPADAALSTPGPSGARRPLFTSTPQGHASSPTSEQELAGIKPLDLTDVTEDSSTSLVIPQEDTIPIAHNRNRRIVDSEHRLNYKVTHEIINLPKRLRCRVCYKSGIRRDTSLGCKTCDVGLCSVPWYTRYHRKKVYWVEKK
ncbi:piggyBac transposable element-derived protein 4-like [Procambarus clarkii]|uniref:piggyBac transposable element-derived protein 4-like n=1 Tax=Procambarus clarkii TaxID=6728 RepID=UPI003742D7C6